MEWTPVTSSNIREISYDRGSQTLYVQFLHGGEYSYSGVPEDIYLGRLSAESVGSFLHQNVKGIYPYKKVA